MSKAHSQKKGQSSWSIGYIQYSNKREAGKPDWETFGQHDGLLKFCGDSLPHETVSSLRARDFYSSATPSPLYHLYSR